MISSATFSSLKVFLDSSEKVQKNLTNPPRQYTCIVLGEKFLLGVYYSFILYTYIHMKNTNLVIWLLVGLFIWAGAMYFGTSYNMSSSGEISATTQSYRGGDFGRHSFNLGSTGPYAGPEQGDDDIQGVKIDYGLHKCTIHWDQGEPPTTPGQVGVNKNGGQCCRPENRDGSADKSGPCRESGMKWVDVIFGDGSYAADTINRGPSDFQK